VIETPIALATSDIQAATTQGLSPWIDTEGWKIAKFVKPDAPGLNL
jgi:hypothetical protein